MACASTHWAEYLGCRHWHSLEAEAAALAAHWPGRSGHLLAYALIPTGTEDPERAGSGPSLAWSPRVRAPSPRQSNWAQRSLGQLQ